MTAPAAFLSARSLCVWMALLAGLLPSSPASQTTAAVLLAVAALLGWSDLRRIPRVLMALVAAAALVAASQAPAALALAIGNTAQLGVLVVAVLLLSSTLGASHDVRLLTGSLLAGRPLARYLGLALATGVLAVPLNFGAVAVMSAMVGRLRQHGGDGVLARNAARAVLRGFALASICSPLSFSVVLTLTMLPGLRLLELIAAAAPFALAFILAGAGFASRRRGGCGRGRCVAPDRPNAQPPPCPCRPGPHGCASAASSPASAWPPMWPAMPAG